MRRILLTLTAGLASTGLLAGSALPAGAADEPPPSIVGIALSSGAPESYDTNGDDYDILRDAVITTGLVGALSGGEWTVFAPNDRAFVRLVTDLTGTAPANEAAAATTIVSLGVPTVTAVLTHHVIAGEPLSRSDVVQSRSLEMFGGGTIGVRGVNLVDADPDLRDPKLIPSGSDIAASNGVIHTIDRVLLPIDL